MRCGASGTAAARCVRPTRRFPTGSGRSNLTCSASANAKPNCCSAAIGITFAVHGDPKAQERLIPFDVIPRILSAAEWETLRRGLEQRVKAINAYIKDVYHRREILRAGIVPEDLVFQNPAFRPEMNGWKVPHYIHVHIAGIDIVCVDADDFVYWAPKTMLARRPACPTCFKTARSCCGCFPSCSRAIASHRSYT